MTYKYTDEKGEHLHTLDGRPLIGASRISKTGSDGGAFTWWASGKALEPFGWTNPKFTAKDERERIAWETRAMIEALDDESYIKLLDDSYKAHDTSKRESATKGTDRHAMVEKWVKNAMAGISGTAERDIWAFVDWAKANVKTFLWSELHCYSVPLWVGGICDVGYETNDGKIGVLDVKSSKEAYPDQFLQCAGYATLIEENGGYTANGEKIFDLNGRKVDVLTVFPFGARRPEGVSRYDVPEGKAAFESAVKLYKYINQIK